MAMIWTVSNASAEENFLIGMGGIQPTVMVKIELENCKYQD